MYVQYAQLKQFLEGLYIFKTNDFIPPSFQRTWDDRLSRVLVCEINSNVSHDISLSLLKITLNYYMLNTTLRFIWRLNEWFIECTSFFLSEPLSLLLWNQLDCHGNMHCYYCYNRPVNVKIKFKCNAINLKRVTFKRITVKIRVVKKIQNCHSHTIYCHTVRL